MSVKLLTEDYLEFLSLKRGCRVRVYTCQNAELLEITCHGSFVGIVIFIEQLKFRAQLNRA